MNDRLSIEEPMSTDLALPTNSTFDLTQFVEDASHVHAIAKALAGTSFVPKAMQGRPDEITGAILFGRELGLNPMVSLQTINVIEGRPSMTANAMRGLAMTHGVVFDLIESTATRCVMKALPPGRMTWTESVWTIDRAKQLGLTNKSNWQKQPQAMLIARATSELCRLVAANVLIGMPYSSEELNDGPHEDQRHANGAAAEPPKRTARRAPVQAHVAEPDPEPYQTAGGSAPVPDQKEPQKEIGYETQDIPARELGDTVPMIDVELRKALMARFNELGIRERNVRLTRVSQILGREIASVNQLNDSEGRAVLRALREDTSWVENGS